MNVASSLLASVGLAEETPMSKTETIHRENERKNLALITRLVLRSFLEQSMRGSRILETDTQEIFDLFIMLEKTLWHGFRSSASRTLLPLRSPDAELWGFLSAVAYKHRDMHESYKCVDQLTNLTTSIAKLRAFLRIAIMQKKLSDYFQYITSAKNLPVYYENWALIRREEDSVSLTGALIGLNVLDCNLQLENENLQHQPLSVDLAQYITMPTIPTETGVEDTVSQDSGLIDEQMKTVLDQKNYLEERNRQLMSKLDNLNRTLQKSKSFSNGSAQFQVTDNEMSEEVAKLEQHRDTLLAKLSETEDAESTLREQLHDTKTLNADLYEKLRIAEENVRKVQRELRRDRQQHLQEKTRLNETIALLTAHNNKSSNESEKDIENQQLRAQIASKFEEHMETMKMLSDKQHEVHCFSEKLIQIEELCKEQTEKLKNYPIMDEELVELRSNYADTWKELLECRKALEELGGHLSESKLKIVELKEEFLPLSEAQWEKDSDVNACKSCDVQFSYSRRKHHCRNCGSIFCQACSNARVRLPSSSKAVRVCSHCYDMLKNRQNSLTDS